MAFYNKDENFLNELNESLSKDRDFRAFKEDFKGFSEKELVEMYVVKNSMQIKDTEDINISKEEKIDSLASIGDFLGKVKKLDEMRKIYNEDILNKTENTLGNENNNPLIVTKKEIKREFDKTENGELPDSVVNMKLAFWENRVTKTLESVKSSSIANYTKLYRKDEMQVKRNLRIMARNTAIYNPKFLEVYEKFLNKEITKQELEKTKEFQKVEKEIKINKEETGFNYSPYMVLNNATMEQQISRSYLAKDIYIKEGLEKEDKNVEKTVYPDSNPRSKFLVVGFKNKDYNLEVDLHYKKEDYEVIKDHIKVEEKEKSAERDPIKAVVLHKFTDEKLEKLKGEIDKKEDYDRDTKKILNFYGDVIEYEGEPKKEHNEREEFINSLQRKRNVNPNRNNHSTRARDDRNRYNRNKNRNRRDNSYERGGR